MTDSFASGARKMLFAALDDAKIDPEALKKRIEMLTHHVRDEHKWEGGECDFHPLIVCSCGQCNKKSVRGKVPILISSQLPLSYPSLLC